MTDGNQNSTARAILHEAIQKIAALDDDLEGGIPLGWVLIAEWMAPTGTRWLSLTDATANLDGLPAWQRAGYLHEALNGGAFPDVIEYAERDPEDDDD